MKGIGRERGKSESTKCDFAQLKGRGKGTYYSRVLSVFLPFGHVGMETTLPPVRIRSSSLPFPLSSLLHARRDKLCRPWHGLTEWLSECQSAVLRSHLLLPTMAMAWHSLPRGGSERAEMEPPHGEGKGSRYADKRWNWVADRRGKEEVRETKGSW